MALIVLVGVFWQLLGDVAAMLIPRDANLATQIADDSIGTHWPAWGEISAENAADPALAAHAENAATVVWLDGTGDAQRLLLAQGERTSETQMAWQAPIMVADGASGLASPQVAVAADGRIHVAWLENPAQPRVMAAVCEAGACGGAVTVAASGACDGQSAESVPPSLSLAINPAGRALAVWGDFGVNAVTFDGADSATDAPVCVPGLTEAGNARIASHPDGSFTLVAEQSGDIVQAVFDADSWQATRVVGQGALPNVWVDEAGDAYVAWCSAESGVSVRHGEQVEQVSALPCLQRPSLAADSEGRLHILFASDEVERVLGDPGMQPVLYESVQSADETQWAPPAIIASSQTRSAASLATDAEGVLFSAWVDALNPAALHVAAKAAYDCTGTDIPRIAQATLDAVADRNFRPSGEQLALCKNQYNRLVYTPNPAPEFSDLPPTENGAFDVLADAMREARYEVLFATMAYDQGADGYGPGVVIAEAVADLYAKLDANPEAYPRGLTVRMLMGNSPKIDLNSQLWDLLADLRTAGVPVMRDPSIGWRLEVANFEGAFPHSHTKLLVVDGTDAITMGFNMEFRAMPIDHPSGRGGGDTDLGVYVTGPVAQDSRRVYDQLWEGAVLRYCPNLYTQIIPWQWYCRDSEAVVDHVPEVMRYAVTDGNTLALSMFRNHVFDESDQKVNAAFQSAETLIDVMHVDFDLPLECVINHFYDVCHFEHALPYMERVVDVVEANDVDVRVLLGVIPIQGVENTVAIEAFNEEIDERGLSDRVEVRWFDGLIHAKTSLIDDEFLIIGSQNLHSSGFGEGVGLTEYNIGVVDPQAIDDYRRLFEYHWERGRP